VGALIMLAPFYFMFVFATHSRTEIFSLPPPLFFGDDFFNNLKILTERMPFWRVDPVVLLYGRLRLRAV
jgi:multiple sugar transport system permease protein